MALPPDLFGISSLAASCWNFGLFPSTGQHIARNRLGTFYLVAMATNDPINFTSTTFSLFLDSGSGPVVIWTGILPSNMACLEAFSTGEVHVIASDFKVGAIHVLYWADASNSATPVHLVPATGAGAAMEKIGTCLDEARRCIYIMGATGYFIRLSATGTLETNQIVTVAINDVAHYWSLVLDEDGHLYVVMCSATDGTHYDAVMAIMTPNPGAPEPVWFSQNRWVPGGPQLHLPANQGKDGPLAWLTTGEQELYYSNLLLSATVEDSRLYVAMFQARSGIRAFGHDDLRDVSVEIVSVPWGSPITDPSARVRRPVRGETIMPRCGSGALVRRGNRRFFIGADRSRLVALAESDDGRWHDYAATTVPSLGTDLIHYISAYRGDTADSDVIGAFEIIHCTPSQWANGTCPVPPAASPTEPTATAYRFSLPIS